jgi:hypothetical protein
MLHYEFVLSHNAFILSRIVIASTKSYRSEHIGPIIASYSYLYDVIEKRYYIYSLSLLGENIFLWRRISDCCHHAIHSNRHLVPVLCCTVPVYKLLCPDDIKHLQHFLSMVNFYRHCLQNCAQVLRPLTDL